MTKSEKVRIEIRFNAIEDKDMIDFIDNNGSTRAGFIKQVLKMYKNQMETMLPNAVDDLHIRNDMINTKKRKRKPTNLADISFSSKDFE